MATTSMKSKDFEKTQDVVLSRLLEFEGEDSDLSRLKHFQKSAIDFIRSETIPKEELDGRFKDLMLTLKQMRTASKADVLRIHFSRNTSVL